MTAHAFSHGERTIHRHHGEFHAVMPAVKALAALGAGTREGTAERFQIVHTDEFAVVGGGRHGAEQALVVGAGVAEANRVDVDAPGRRLGAQAQNGALLRGGLAVGEDPEPFERPLLEGVRHAVEDLQRHPQAGGDVGSGRFQLVRQGGDALLQPAIVRFGRARDHETAAMKTHNADVVAAIHFSMGAATSMAGRRIAVLAGGGLRTAISGF